VPKLISYIFPPITSNWILNHQINVSGALYLMSIMTRGSVSRYTFEKKTPMMRCQIV
jgi:hypothetical protein